jgi:NAD(P)-dependent dehydrogenase (short-subunit alcohol dehydrogenase family)
MAELTFAIGSEKKVVPSDGSAADAPLVVVASSGDSIVVRELTRILIRTRTRHFIGNFESAPSSLVASLLAIDRSVLLTSAVNLMIIQATEDRAVGGRMYVYDLLRNIASAGISIRNCGYVTIESAHDDDNDANVSSDGRLGVRTLLASFGEHIGLENIKVICCSDRFGLARELISELASLEGLKVVRYDDRGRSVAIWSPLGAEPESNDSLGRGAIIIGGLGGVGRIVGEVLLGQNRHVIAVGRWAFRDLSAEAQSYVEELNRSNQGRFQYQSLKTMTVEDVLRLLAKTSAAGGKIDVLIQLASEAMDSTAFKDFERNDLVEKKYSLKIRGSSVLVDAGLKFGIERYVFVNSVLAHVGSAAATDYSVACGAQSEIANLLCRSRGANIKEILLSQVFGTGMSSKASVNIGSYLASRGMISLTREQAGTELLKALRAAAMKIAIGIVPEHVLFNGIPASPSLDKSEHGLLRRGIAVDDVEAVIRRIWSQLLKKEQLEADFNWFRHGANSLDLLTAYDMLTTKISQHISISDLYEFPTVGELSRHIQARIKN